MARTQTLDYPITNTYTFARVFSDPNNVRPLLEEVLGTPVGRIRYVGAEHGIDPSLRSHGVRMDVYVEDGDGTVYDVEMQNTNEGDLALRSRYLLSSFDRDRLARGAHYAELGRTLVIFVCEFDPFELGKRVYVVRPAVGGCDASFDDGTMRVFLNASGAADDPSSGGRLPAFLSYVDGGTIKNDAWIERLDREVRALNADKGWRETVLSFEGLLEEKTWKARRDAMAEGLAEGREKGLLAGREEGLIEGRAEGRAKGRAEGRKEAAQLAKRLAQALRDAGRDDELFEAMTDAETQARLLEEFGLPQTIAPQEEAH